MRLFNKQTKILFLISLVITITALVIIFASFNGFPSISDNSQPEFPPFNEKGDPIVAIVSGTPVYADGKIAISGVTIDPPVVLPDFTLQSNENDPVSLSDFKGKYVLLFFGYTHCPDVCPLTLGGFRRIKNELEENLNDDIIFMFITVDSIRDTPERLSEYLAAFDVPIVALRGTDEELSEIGKPFELKWEIIEPGAVSSMDSSNGHQHDHMLESGEYLIDHTSSRFLIDPDGALIRRYLYNSDPATSASLILADLRPLLLNLSQ